MSATTMEITIWDDDDYEETHVIPADWKICGTCKGNGGHSRRLGAITGDEWAEDWDPEEREMYLRGDYDEICEDCKGLGRVKVPAFPEEEPAKTWLEDQVARARMEHEDRITLYWESGGTMGSRNGSRW